MNIIELAFGVIFLSLFLFGLGLLIAVDMKEYCASKGVNISHPDWQDECNVTTYNYTELKQAYDSYGLI